MIGERRVLAVVPARSGSKAIPHKNVAVVAGHSLIGWAGILLEGCSFVDARVVSTDSPEYAAEARRYGLAAPFLRPAEIAGDAAGDVEVLAHAILASEAHYGGRFDVVVMIQPTSPVRFPADVEACVSRLVRTGADSVVSVAPLDKKFNPEKVLRVGPDGRLEFYHAAGAAVKGRQGLPAYHYRDGACYALWRETILGKGRIFTETTLAHVTDHPVVNIDERDELAIAEIMLRRFGERVGAKRSDEGGERP